MAVYLSRGNAKDTGSDTGNDPVNDPVNNPVINPVKPPVDNPVINPVNNPVNNPVKPPVINPVKPPVNPNDIANALANAQKAANALYYALQDAYAQLQRDGAQDSNFMSFTGAYAMIVPSATFTFMGKASAAIAVIRDINSKIALTGCKPQTSSQCGYFTMLLSLTPSSPAMFSIASESKDIPTYFAPLRDLIIDCNRVYNDVLTAVNNVGYGNSTVSATTVFQAQGYVPNYSPDYFSSVTYLATNIDTLVNNATQTGQILARMLS